MAAIVQLLRCDADFAFAQTAFQFPALALTTSKSVHVASAREPLHSGRAFVACRLRDTCLIFEEVVRAQVRAFLFDAPLMPLSRSWRRLHA